MARPWARPDYVSRRGEAPNCTGKVASVRADVDMEVMRWLTIGAPGQDDFQILLEKPTNSFIDEESRGQIGSLLSKGAMGLGFILYTDDCRRTFDDLVAKGVEAIDEPTGRFYGIDCAVRDPFGNHIRITEPAAPEDFNPPS